MKRIVTAVLAAVLAGFVLACGQSAPHNPTPEPVRTSTPSPIGHPSASPSDTTAAR